MASKNATVVLAAMGTVSTVETVNRGQKAEEFYLNRRQAILITAKSDTAKAIDVTIEVIRKFDAYERGVQPKQEATPVAFDLNNLDAVLALSSQLTRALTVTQAKVVALKMINAELEAKAAAWESIANASGVILISKSAKAAGVSRGWLADFLDAIGWCFRRDGVHKGPLMADIEFLCRGWMVQKLTTYSRSDGSLGRRVRLYLTPAGAAKLMELLEPCLKMGVR